jgi:hypothetical protein
MLESHPATKEGAMPEKKEPRSTTYGDLKSGDVIVDKSGNEWTVLDHAHTEVETVAFWLADPATKVRAHYLTKSRVERATVLRPATHVEKVEAAEAEMPTPADVLQGAAVEHLSRPLPVEEVVEALGAEVVAEETAAEHDAKVEATEEEPLTLPPFSEFTDLEMRSHLYLVHGVYAADVKFREKLAELHAEAHGVDRLGFPHTHVEGASFPTEGGES